MGSLPQELWERILSLANGRDFFALSMTCREFRELVDRRKKRSGRKYTNTIELRDWRWRRSRGWMLWVYSLMASDPRVGEDKIVPLVADLEYLAVMMKDLSVLKFLKSEGHFYHLRCHGARQTRPKNYFVAASCSGSVEILDWLVESGVRMGCEDPQCWENATSNGHIPAIRFFVDRLNENDSRWNSPYACGNAAEGGHLDALRWLRDRGFPWHEGTCWRAAGGNHLDVLKFARENGCPWDEDTMNEAANGGHLEVLRWARENGAPWNAWTTWHAAKSGHLEVLKWLVAHGCPLNARRCIRVAREVKRADVVRWLIEEKKEEDDGSFF